MNITFKRIAAVATIMVLPCSALAASTVTFQGEVTDETCNININGDTNSIVLLPTVKASDLATNGAKAGITPFTITLTNCGGSDSGLTNAKTVTTNFLGHNVISAQGILGNSETVSDAASEVGIQLLEADNTDATAINLSGITAADSKISLASGDTTGSHTFGAQYYAPGKATAGKVSAMAEYTVSYN